MDFNLLLALLLQPPHDLLLLFSVFSLLLLAELLFCSFANFLALVRSTGILSDHARALEKSFSKVLDFLSSCLLRGPH